MLIVVDTSAVLSIILNEDPAPELAKRLTAATRREMSAANYVEAGTVLAGRLDIPTDAAEALDSFLAQAQIDVVPLDAALARLAVTARVRFGKGFGHPANLNYGDSFAYALAKHRNAPLLFIGNDFSQTDVQAAI